MNADDVLRALAARNGIHPTWRDAWGHERSVGIDTLRALLAALDIPAATPIEAVESLRQAEELSWPSTIPAFLAADAGGPVDLHLTRPSADAGRIVRWSITIDGHVETGQAECRPFAPGPDGNAVRCVLTIGAPSNAGSGTLAVEEGAWGTASLILAPPACFAIAPGRRLWGLTAQIYGLRQNGDGGAGHYAALAGFAERAASAGASALGISPTHALFTADTGHFSPYAPSDRRFYNALLSDPGWVPGVTMAPGIGPIEDRLRDLIERAEAAALIDYPTALAARRDLLRLMFDAFTARHVGELPDAVGRDFLDFRATGGHALERHALFEALHGHFFQINPSNWDWRGWPEPYRDPTTAQVAQFAAENATTVSFHCFLQWLATRQLEAVQQATRAAGMPIGLIADLAVGTHAGGGRSWSDRGSMLNRISIGAPPDLLAPQGQDWGLTAFSPTALRASAFAGFQADLDAVMRIAGGVRIDHVMGLSRIWCIPEGASSDQGAYLRMPWDDFRRVLALRSQHRRCIVIGEDLGTVPEGFREELERQKILGISVLWFERGQDGGFHAPEGFPVSSVATSSTHDLPTVVGWWLGRDIEWRTRLGHLGADAVQAMWVERAAARAALWQALHKSGVVGSALVPESLDAPAVAAIARFLAATPSPLVLLPLEDALLDDEQPNLPGTMLEHPNWRRRLRGPYPALLDDGQTQQIFAALSAARPDRMLQ